MRAWKPCAVDDDHSGNGASANAKTMVLLSVLMVFQVLAFSPSLPPEGQKSTKNASKIEPEFT